MYKILLIAAGLTIPLSSQAQASEGATLLEKHLYAGKLNDGIGALAALGDGDPAQTAEKKSAQGLIGFVAAIEKLGQALHRHGLETTRGGVMMQLPILRMPVEPNPNPEPLDYQKYRTILEALFNDLNAADALLDAGANGDYKFPLDLAKIRIDINSDGTASDTESLGAIMSALTGAATQEVAPDLQFAFDKADILWLRGYIHFLTAGLQFGLAMDFEDSFNKTGHAWFPRAGLPMSSVLLEPVVGSGFVDNALGDALAFVHLLNWKVEDPARLSNSRTRLAAMANLSRQSWAAARAETDNDKEWLPNAKQTGRWGMSVDDATIDSWLAVMGEFETVLDGKKLMPHWRFQKGFNVKRFFEESKQVDLVLMVAGADAVPFLEDGPVSTSTEWNSLMRAFRGNFLNYAIWFN